MMMVCYLVDCRWINLPAVRVAKDSLSACFSKFTTSFVSINKSMHTCAHAHTHTHQITKNPVDHSAELNMHTQLHYNSTQAPAQSFTSSCACSNTFLSHQFQRASLSHLLKICFFEASISYHTSFMQFIILTQFAKQPFAIKLTGYMILSDHFFKYLDRIDTQIISTKTSE